VGAVVAAFETATNSAVGELTRVAIQTIAADRPASKGR
jgi:hypothetical protein